MINNKTKHLAQLYIYIILAIVSYTGCRKDWLEEKPSKSLVVPSTIEDYQKLLDNSSYYNNNATVLGELASDTYYAPASLWATVSVIEKNTYIWNSDPFQGNSVANWNRPYANIYRDNLVLEGAEKLAGGNSGNAAWKNIKGTALFFRAYDEYTLSQIFCQAYNPATAASDLGIPLKFEANVNEKTVRASVAQTYSQIISDLKASITLLPTTPVYKTRPSRPAGYAMLARVYLSMEDYRNALTYADSCLNIYNKLLDYTALNPTASRPFSRYNDEVILDWALGGLAINYNGKVDTVLYNSYSTTDLRKALFFNTSTFAYKGSYNGSIIPFNGLAVDELYLIRAECAARLGNPDLAKASLNTLLKTRYKTGTYTDVTASDAAELLGIILNERKKELAFRGLRWSDLRRLNRDPRFAITLKRNLNGQVYTLPPNDLRYVFPIPANEILASGIPQNPR